MSNLIYDPTVAYHPDMLPRPVHREARQGVARQLVRALTGSAAVEANAYVEDRRVQVAYDVARAGQRNVALLSMEEAFLCEQAPHAVRRLQCIGDEYAELARRSVNGLARDW